MGEIVMIQETEKIISTIRSAQKLLGERLDPATPGDDRETLSRVLDLLDDERFNEAVKELEMEAHPVRTTWLPKTM
jgi:hypothetical protein